LGSAAGRLPRIGWPRRQAIAVLENCDVDDLDDGHDEMRRYKSLSHGPAPKVMKVDGLEAAVAQALASLLTVRQCVTLSRANF